MNKFVLALVFSLFLLNNFVLAEEKVNIQEQNISSFTSEQKSDDLKKRILERLDENIKNIDITENNSGYISSIIWGTPKNEKVDTFLNYFKTRLKDRFAVWLSRSSRYLPIINKIFEEHGLASELVFLPLIESGFSPYATSRAQAVGIWQFIKGTAIRYGLRVDNFIDERRDPEKSAIAAAKYLKDLYEMFGSWDLALAAYNAGEGKIMRIINSKGTNDFWEVIKHKKVKRETKEYVPRFVAASLIAKEPEEYGFEDIKYLPPLEYEEVLLPPKTTLASVGKIIDVDEDTLKEYNPAIKYGVLPPDTSYYVRIPKDKVQVLLDNFDSLERADEKTIKKIMAKKDKTKRYMKKNKKRVYKKVANVKRISNPL
ncbi:MAG: transglycosylase SLT domain-containing protein [Proteobacteria bacterium]|nr:transglycosylase SLT domain-containing protein [Pseudomonadota bacterium]